VDQDGYIQTINSLKKHYIKLIQQQLRNL